MGPKGMAENGKGDKQPPENGMGFFVRTRIGWTNFGINGCSGISTEPTDGTGKRGAMIWI